MATVSQPRFTFTHISISGVHFATVAYTTCPTAFHGNANTRGGSTVPASLNTHSFPHTRNMQWVQERFWKRHLTQVGAALVSRRDPCPLLKPSTACAIDFYCQGCSTPCSLSTGLRTGLANLAALQRSASRSQLMIRVLHFDSGQGQLSWKWSHG